jgi:hypothetical protein
MEQILDELKTEREKQKTMWDHDDSHTEETWSVIIMHELAHACFSPDGSESFRKQMIKVAAVAVAAIEAYDAVAPGIFYAA